jgi:dTDP-4-dehydrorhamnose 3,5-epimerase
MEFFPTEIPDVIVLKPRVFEDERGYFFESYNAELFSQLGIHHDFLQDNQSLSAKGVIRGLHFQRPPFEQGKLVRVISGSVFDVAVDLRLGSPWFGRWVGRELSSENKLMMWIPPGFAHGFVSREEGSIFQYKCTNVYMREAEVSIRWDDKELAIDWACDHPIVSAKDASQPFFGEIRSPFVYVQKQ